MWSCGDGSVPRGGQRETDEGNISVTASSRGRVKMMLLVKTENWWGVELTIRIYCCALGVMRTFVFVRLYESQSLRIEWNLWEWPIATLIFPPCPAQNGFRRKSENSKQSIPILILSIHNPIQLCRRAKRHQSQTNKVSTVGLFVSALCFAALTALYLHLASESLRQKDKKTTWQKDTKTKRKDQQESLSGQFRNVLWATLVALHSTLPSRSVTGQSFKLA